MQLEIMFKAFFSLYNAKAAFSVNYVIEHLNYWAQLVSLIAYAYLAPMEGKEAFRWLFYPSVF